MSRHWEELVVPVYNTRERDCEAKVGGGVSALQRARGAEHHPQPCRGEVSDRGTCLGHRGMGHLLVWQSGPLGLVARTPAHHL